jgi:hypothetical protein
MRMLVGDRKPWYAVVLNEAVSDTHRALRDEDPPGVRKSTVEAVA